MNPLPQKIILSLHPKEHHKQGFIFCGGYWAKAILEAYGISYSKHPQTLATEVLLFSSEKNITYPF